MTSQELAKRAGTHRQMISKLENGHIPPDLDEVLALLEALGVEGAEWTDLVGIANEAASRGWWDGISRQIGERQALIADLEAGAATIREYPQALIPGLLQTPGYTRFRAGTDGRPMADGVTTDGILRGRANRQRMIKRTGGTTAYHAIIDEIAIRRLAVPSEIMCDQLLEVVAICQADERFTVRVLPIDAQFENHAVPISSFKVYTYDNGDPTVVAIEGMTEDAILTSEQQSEAYERFFGWLNAAALSVEESEKFLIKAAEKLRP